VFESFRSARVRSRRHGTCFRERGAHTQHLKGTAGLKSGSQPPPGAYFIAPMLYVYKADQVKDADGNRPTAAAADLDSQLFGGGVSVVTQRKLLGGFYGFQVLLPVGRTTGFRAPRSAPIPAPVSAIR